MAGSLTKVGIGKEDCVIAEGAAYPSTYSRQGSLQVLTGLTEMPNLWLTHTASYNARAYNDGEFTNATITAAMADIGTTDNRTLYLEPGTWVISDDITITSNIFLEITPGALLQVANGKTFTAYSPANVIAQSGTQIVTGDGSLAFTAGEGKRYTSWWGNGATSLDDAVNSCTVGGTIVVDGDLATSATTTIDVDGTTIEKFGDPTITYTGTGRAIRIEGYHIVWKDIQVTRSAIEWQDGTDTTSVGIELYNSRYCWVDASIEGFYKGLQVYGDAAGCYFNTTNIKLIYDNCRGVNITSANSGAANNNVFLDGYVIWRSTSVTAANGAATDMYSAAIIYSDYANNNNTFYNVAFESPVNSAYIDLLYVAGVYNSFIGCRYEINSYDGSYTPIVFAATGNYNKIDGGRWVSSAYGIDEIVDDNALGNVINIAHEEKNHNWHRQIVDEKTTGATGDVAWSITVPDDSVMQVIVNLVGRLSDNTKYVQMVMRGVYTATGGAASLGASEYTDPAALNVGGFDVTDIVLDANGALARLIVGGNAASNYYFSAVVEWQIVTNLG